MVSTGPSALEFQLLSEKINEMNARIKQMNTEQLTQKTENQQAYIPKKNSSSRPNYEQRNPPRCYHCNRFGHFI